MFAIKSLIRKKMIFLKKELIFREDKENTRACPCDIVTLSI
ncbi:hypothetical protein LEP1GSC194_0356 [Leptospira alstonii serovar Sichuan str. 79601]|uniref:Uncharacterized protein n=1 Tax=Leptospira alstonii serovar Sichuan str. 79601 TaxID=1218565 RepID=M6CVK1_9LEPT|nr:hypothetical protein LEP1GSC194_0356 [Leptospira alstonii serovar Sichuan str. 79601]